MGNMWCRSSWQQDVPRILSSIPQVLVTGTNKNEGSKCVGGHGEHCLPGPTGVMPSTSSAPGSPTSGSSRESGFSGCTLLSASAFVASASALVQGLTLVHVSAQLEPCLTHKTPYTPYALFNTPFNTGYANPTRTPYPVKHAQVEPRSERV